MIVLETLESGLRGEYNWRQSVLGSPISLWSWQNSAQDYTKLAPFLFVGGVHGDEPEGVRLASDMLLWVKSLSDISAMHSFMLIPCLNVDGFSRKERVNAHHVDLNRNFPSRDWMAEAKAPRYFPGTHPGSEPETKALIQLLETQKFSAIFHFHSWQPCVVYSGGTAGVKFAEPLAHASGYSLQEDIGYPTPGSLGQYGWLEHQTPVICVEEKENINLDEVWPHFQKGIMELLCCK